MYPPRSAKYKQEKKKKQQKQNRVWMLINLTLILIVCLLGIFYYYEQKNTGSNAGAENASNASIPGASSADAQSGNGSGGEPPSGGTPSGNAGGSPSSSPSQAPAPSDSGTGAPASSGADTGGQNDGSSLVLHFGGDTLFAGKVGEKLAAAGFDFPFQYVSNMFQQDDLTVLNLETPVTENGVSAEDKQYVFKSPPQALDAMAKAGVDAVNLANNHTLDQGAEGLLDTLKFLKNAGIASVGAGKNANEAFTPYYTERKGVKIALLGFSRVLPKASWNAGANTPGLAGVYDPTRAYEEIRQAKQQADLVIVIVHWGKERVQQIDSTQSDLAHGFIDAGADLVIGGHPHILQGLEQYKGKWIAYSTGNFIFTRSTNEKTWETAVFEARCTKSGNCGMKLIPYETELAQPVPMNAEDGAALLSEIQTLSPGVTVDSEGNLASR